MRVENAPETLALIPDGNRRWARKHRLSFFRGYKLGVDRFVDFAEWCRHYGVRNITVWAFSTENFRRSISERTILFNIYKRFANDKEMLSRLINNETRFNVVGNKALLPRDLVEALHKIEVQTRNYTERTINMMLAYGGKDDILHATRKLVRRGVRNVTDAMFRSYMISNKVPDIDMVIRTSGEERLSGFMPWQSSYSELYFSNKLWPDFTKRDLDKALMEYGRRQRRFGN